MRSNAAVAANESLEEDLQKAAALPDPGIHPPRIVTTSWDDGDPSDLEVARWLADRKLSGTFYIPVKGHHGSGRMGRAEVLTLASGGFEIGAHGVSHPNLTRCTSQQLAVEVEGSKKRLEDDLGKDVAMFAYPRGKHSRSVIASVKQAGFAGARTTAMLACELNFDPFRMPTSVHVFPHARADYLRNLARAGDFGRAWVYMTRFWPAANWVELALHLFDRVLRNGGVWHLYGHSWEVKDHSLRDALAGVLDYVARRPEVMYLPNSAVARLAAGNSLGAVMCGQESAL